MVGRMPQTVSSLQVARMRLVAQRLVGEPLATPSDVVGHLVCTQSQDWRACRLAIAARTASRLIIEVDTAFNEGGIVRSWPMRGTLHTVLAADLRWMLAVTGDRIRAQYRSRLVALGIDAPTIDRAHVLTRDALSGRRGLTRRELLDAWTESGIDTRGQRGAHLLIDLSISSAICLGPTKQGVQQFVLCDDWLPVDEPSADPVIGWARRYFTGHGPASRADFLGWSKLLVREVAPVWEQITDGFVPLDLGGVTLYAAPQIVEAGTSRQTLEPLLTAAFDEILLGYADRSPTLDPSYAQRIVPGGNGMFKPVVIDGGRAVGTWSRPKNPQDPPVIDLFVTPHSARVARLRIPAH